MPAVPPTARSAGDRRWPAVWDRALSALQASGTEAFPKAHFTVIRNVETTASCALQEPDDQTRMRCHVNHGRQPAAVPGRFRVAHAASDLHRCALRLRWANPRGQGYTAARMKGKGCRNCSATVTMQVFGTNVCQCSGARAHRCSE